MELDPEEMRVLGCLAEKQLTTPVQYPLTLNALTLACNQSTSRDPVVSYDEATVEAAVTRAKTMGLARFFHPAHGRSALRFGHTLDEALGIDVPRLALLAVLMLRGPQTLAELRARTQRMTEFSDTVELEAELDALARLDPPIVRRIGRQPGQKEDRYEQLLGADAPEAHPLPPRASAPPPPPLADRALPERASADGAPPDRATGPPSRADAAPVGGTGSTEPMAVQLAELRAEVAALRRDVDDLRFQLGV
jgi:uncharacterized protein YceH (UPF0502 family)